MYTLYFLDISIVFVITYFGSQIILYILISIMLGTFIFATLVLKIFKQLSGFNFWKRSHIYVL